MTGSLSLSGSVNSFTVGGVASKQWQHNLYLTLHFRLTNHTMYSYSNSYVTMAYTYTYQSHYISDIRTTDQFKYAVDSDSLVLLIFRRILDKVIGSGKAGKTLALLVILLSTVFI